MAPAVAVVFCVHHKPWLIMSTLITLAAQGRDDLDLHFLYQIGGGACVARPSYAEYHRLAAELGDDPQLSPYDDRVRSVTRVGWRTSETCLENDGALDSGAWYKFIRSREWERYDYILFLGEGSLFARVDSLSAMLEFARAHDVHWIAGAHEKRRMPKNEIMFHNSRRPNATEMQAFHDRMTQSVFEIFGRDVSFRDLVSAWSSDFKTQTQDHVPDIWGRVTRPRDAANRREGTENLTARGVRYAARRFFYEMDAVLSGMAIAAGWQRDLRPVPADRIYVDRVLTRVDRVVETQLVGHSRFHLEPGPEWFGAATNHLMSRRSLRSFVDKLDAFDMWAAVEVPFAGTALEVVWGFVPHWLGLEKWFTDGIHRVRKHFVTYRREDDPEGMASYINRYFRGRLQVAPDGDYLRIRRLHPSIASAKSKLPPEYFA